MNLIVRLYYFLVPRKVRMRFYIKQKLQLLKDQGYTEQQIKNVENLMKVELLQKKE